MATIRVVDRNSGRALQTLQVAEGTYNIEYPGYSPQQVTVGPSDDVTVYLTPRFGVL